jgi:hypothetical protein
MHDTGGPLTASDLIQILSGDVKHMRALELPQHSEIAKVAEEMPSTSLVLKPDAVKRVLTGLLKREIFPEQAQKWASFVKHGYKSGGHEAVLPILIPYETSHEDDIAEAVGRLDELGDLIDGTLDGDEIRLLLKKLDK